MEITHTPEQIIRAYGGLLGCRDYARPRHIDMEVKCHVLPTKFVRGNTAIGGPFPLDIALTEQYEQDCHFTQYVCKQEVRGIKSCAAEYDLEFRFCAFDADYAGHKERPTRESFLALIRMCFATDRMPNVMYETKHGCRLIYLIRPLYDAALFETYSGALMTRLAEACARSSSHLYEIDTNCKDWSRLFRLPLVVRDGVAEYDRLIIMFHDDVMDLTSFRAPKRKPRTAPPPSGNRPFMANDPKLLRLLRSELVPGNRNNCLFAGLCHVYRTYDEGAAATWVEVLREAALNAGLDEAEFDQVHKSASKQSR